MPNFVLRWCAWSFTTCDNERGVYSILLQVYKISIGAACALTWPPDRIIIQVLDDSTDPFIKVTHTSARYAVYFVSLHDHMESFWIKM